MYLQEQYSQVLQRLEDRLAWYQRWFEANNRNVTYLFVANIAVSLGATVAGIFKMPTVAALFGAAMATLLTIQKSTAFETRAAWASAKIPRFRILINRLTLEEQNTETLKDVSKEYMELLADEANLPATIKGLPK